MLTLLCRYALPCSDNDFSELTSFMIQVCRIDNQSGHPAYPLRLGQRPRRQRTMIFDELGTPQRR